MTTGKTIALTRRSFVGKVMSLLFNMLSKLVITFLPRSKHLLISWLQSPSAVTLEPRKIKSDIVSTSSCHEVMEPDAMIFVFWMLSFKPTFHTPLSLSSRGSLVRARKASLVKAMAFPVVMYGCESWTIKKAESWRIDAFELWCWNCGVEDSWESLGLQGDPTSLFWRRSTLGFLWKEWC